MPYLYFSLVIFLLFGHLSCVNSQSNKQSIKKSINCTNGRFEKDVFFTLTTHTDVKYSRNITMQGETIDLAMDIFEPEDDPSSLRPLVIWAHGGYFCFGDKSNFHSLCKFVSHKGWVSASIDYRKWDGPAMPDSLEYMETAIIATHDLHAAIRFFKADAAGLNQYKIDTNKIFVGGYSAGGIMAAQVAYLDQLTEVPVHLQRIFNVNFGLTSF